MIKRVIDEDPLVCYAILMGCDYISNAVRLRQDGKKQYILYLQTFDNEDASKAYDIWLNNLSKLINKLKRFAKSVPLTVKPFF